MTYMPFVFLSHFYLFVWLRPDRPLPFKALSPFVTAATTFNHQHDSGDDTCGFNCFPFGV